MNEPVFKFRVGQKVQHVFEEPNKPVTILKQLTTLLPAYLVKNRRGVEYRAAEFELSEIKHAKS